MHLSFHKELENDDEEHGREEPKAEREQDLPPTVVVVRNENYGRDGCKQEEEEPADPSVIDAPKIGVRKECAHNGAHVHGLHGRERPSVVELTNGIRSNVLKVVLEAPNDPLWNVQVERKEEVYGLTGGNGENRTAQTHQERYGLRPSKHGGANGYVVTAFVHFFVL